MSDAATALPVLRASLAAFFSCSWCVICSTGRTSSILSVAVGRSARTVKEQSSWFCSKRRLRLFTSGM
jgi:hypothetical protein